MLGFAIVTFAIFGTGIAVARLLYRRFESEETPAIERAVAGIVIGLSLWLGVNWILSFFHALNRRNLWIAAALFGIGALTAIRRPRLRVTPWLLIAGLAIAAWTGFILWRGSVVPPASHDALAYHLPKAVMIMRAEGHERFDWPDTRLQQHPSNYELLLADVLILSGNDRLTEWIGTACWLAFLAIVALYATRWWGEGLHVTACVLAVASAPLLLLHSGHDKNDLLTGILGAGAIYWSARWCARGGVAPAALAIICGAAAVGTKLNAVVVAIGVAPFGIAALLRRPPRARALLGAVVFAAAVFLLCGGWFFVQPSAPSLAGHDATYGQWANLVDVPYLMVRVSLGFDARLPWSSARWPWPPYDLYGSHYGPVLGGAFLLLPFCLWRYRRDGGDALRRERAIATAAAIVGFIILLPLVQLPRHVSQATLRYSLFLLPAVIAWTVAPLWKRFPPAIARIATGAILVIAVQQAIQTAAFDTFAPIEHARFCARHPGTRRIHWMPNRAGSVVDAKAGPRDTVAMHGGAADIWVHPVYGRELTRTVVFVRNAAEIPPDAQWVAIDYMPVRENDARGEEVRLYEELRRDPRFALVYYNERFNQAVFKRR